jgi:ketosteroid isomerase-like protein
MSVEGEPVQPEAEAAIRAELERYVAAALNQDWERFSQTFDPEPLCMPAGVSAMTTRSAIRDFYSQMPPLDSLALTPDQFEMAGELIIEVGRYEFAAADMLDSGKYLHVWRRQDDGTWRLYRNIANSDGSSDI